MLRTRYRHCRGALDSHGRLYHGGRRCRPCAQGGGIRADVGKPDDAGGVHARRIDRNIPVQRIRTDLCSRKNVGLSLIRTGRTSCAGLQAGRPQRRTQNLRRSTRNRNSKRRLRGSRKRLIDIQKSFGKVGGFGQRPAGDVGVERQLHGVLGDGLSLWRWRTASAVQHQVTYPFGDSRGANNIWISRYGTARKPGDARRR